MITRTLALSLLSIAHLLVHAGADEPPRPALVIVVSIDQLPREYLDRFEAGMDERGFFRRLRDHGADYTHCRYLQSNTVTAVGHSVISTGAYPDVSGIIENEWFDRENRKSANVIDDAEYGILGAPVADGEHGASPRRLLVPTIGDELKLATNGRGRVFGVAFKDRSAILMTGFRADGAFWFHARSGRMVTSRYYMSEVPAWLSAFNDSEPVAKLANAEWDLLLPREKYTEYYADSEPFEANLPYMSKSFPKKLPADPRLLNAAVFLSPFGNDLTLDLARLIVQNEKLGQDEYPDLLCVSLSPNDAVGHMFGPYSLEIQDMTWRTDRQLGDFVDFISSHMGDRPWTLFLTADHGVAPIPEYAAAMKFHAGRKPLGSSSEFKKSLNERLAAVLGAPADGKPFVIELNDSDVYLDRKLPELAGDKFLTAQRIVRDALIDVPGVAFAYTRESLLSGGGDDDVFRSVRRSFFPQRSGDVLYGLSPYYLPGAGNRASHGTPWVYDQHVPLFVMASSGVKPGRYDRPVHPASIAATIAAMLRIQPPPGCTAEPLYETLAP